MAIDSRCYECMQRKRPPNCYNCGHATKIPKDDMGDDFNGAIDDGIKRLEEGPRN